MIQNQDIIIVGQQAWDVEIGSNCKNIALEFSKYNRVLYVNPPLDRITKMRYFKDPKVSKRIKIIQEKKVTLEKIRENLWVYYPDVLLESINWIRIHKLFVFFNKKNSKLFAYSIQKPIEELAFCNYLLFNDSDIFRSFHLKDILRPKLSIYYSRDNMVATEYWRRHGRILEPQLIQQSDLCVSNSEFLRNYCGKFNVNSYYVGQGCDFDLHRKDDPHFVPDELQFIKSPIIGYVGALTALRLDIQLLEYIAETSPHWRIVLVGPQDEVFQNSNLHHFKNVFFLGAKRPEDLPQYISAFDVCINPQVLNDLTIGNYPRKVDEYLALGKPVVATRTETMSVFEEYVSLATNKEEFAKMIEESFTSNSIDLQERRREFALSHSWENSVKSIYVSIEKYTEMEERSLSLT